jgi:hypothetical protein
MRAERKEKFQWKFLARSQDTRKARGREYLREVRRGHSSYEKRVIRTRKVSQK